MLPAEAIEALERGDRSAIRASRGMDGLSQAYFLRIAQCLGSDPPAAIRLGRAYRLLLEFGDRADYVWRARGGALRAEGKWKQSAAAFLLAGEAAHDPIERLTFTVGAIDSFARAGMGEEAIRLGRRLSRRLAPLDPMQAARASLNLGNALIWQDRYREASRAYSRAIDHVPTDFERAAVLLGRSTATLFHGQLPEAQADALEAKAIFESLELEVHAAQADVNLARIDLLTGRLDDAWERLRRLEEDLDSLPDQARTLEFLGDTYFALNLYEEAVSAYRSAEGLARSMPLNRGNDLFGLGRALDRLGKPREASNALSKAVRAYRKVGNEAWELIARAELAQLQSNGRRLMPIARRLEALGSRFAAAEVALAAAQLGDGEALEFARSLIRRYGYTSLRWRLDWQTARHSGRLADFRRMARGLVADRLMVRSIAARTAYLRDRGVALREFLVRLLEEGSPKSLREALRWIAQTRSAALIDEIIAAPDYEPLREKLEWLRDKTPKSARADGARYAPPVRLRGDVVRLGFAQLGATPAITLFDEGAATSVWVDLGESFSKISRHGVESVPTRCIKDTLRWLQFEMMGPMSLRTADSAACDELVADLRRLLGEHESTICPDGLLWQVPWPLLSEAEPIVALSPQFRAGADWRLPDGPRVCIWAQIDPTLPAVAQEVRALQRCFPSAKVCTTAEQARDSLSESWDYLHVATHARSNRDNPMFGYVEFSDGPVFGVEIARSRLDVKLAVLAACDTARFNLDFPEEPHGLARAFLARGAFAVIAAQWPLDDEAACVTIESFANALAEGETVRTSLARARGRCRSQFAHPYFWGALILLAGYRNERT
jgi:tetratricopeptide (TPR) repeat protein